MENIATVVWISAGGIYLLLLFMFFFFWYHFHEMKKSYWKNRHRVEVKEKIKPIDLTPRPTKHGLRVKPKYRTDEKLFEIEQNPAKQ
jgi:hypothetical protein